MATSPCEPTPEELAAIVAAVTLAWPAPAPAPTPPPARPRRGPSAGWRFSGRWWAPARAGERRPPPGRAT
ncbi:MAG TPA: hypothetical protein VM242_04610 [Acidimicrobiales bacterium]|nr:hypothetical protein [Acidimicrobiales bacterium]